MKNQASQKSWTKTTKRYRNRHGRPAKNWRHREACHRFNRALRRSGRAEANREAESHLEHGERDATLDYCRVCFDVGFCQGRKLGTSTCGEQTR